MLPNHVKDELAKFHWSSHIFSREFNFNILECHVNAYCTDYEIFIWERLIKLNHYFDKIEPSYDTSPVLRDVVRCLYISCHWFCSYIYFCAFHNGVTIPMTIKTRPQYHFRSTVTRNKSSKNHKIPVIKLRTIEDYTGGGFTISFNIDLTELDIQKASEYLHYTEYLINTNSKQIHSVVMTIVAANARTAAILNKSVQRVIKSASENPNVKTFKELMIFVQKHKLSTLINRENYGNEASTKEEIYLWDWFKQFRQEQELKRNELLKFQKYIN